MFKLGCTQVSDCELAKHEIKPAHTHAFLYHGYLQVNLFFAFKSQNMQIRLYLSLGAEMGVERLVKLNGLTEPQIVKKLEELVKAGGSMP